MSKKETNVIKVNLDDIPDIKNIKINKKTSCEVTACFSLLFFLRVVLKRYLYIAIKNGHRFLKAFAKCREYLHQLLCLFFLSTVSSNHLKIIIG